MAAIRVDALEKRVKLREGLLSGDTLRFPGAFSPLVALVLERLGFDGIYVSGAGVANNLGYPDAGLTTLTEVVQSGQSIANTVSLPTVIDIDTGFGNAANVARAVWEMENGGLAGCHIEDQAGPKRCGHLSGKELIDTSSMVAKVRAAALAKRDPNFLIIARTDARGPEGFDQAVNRAKAYADAGAEMIFPEALETEREFERFREAITIPLVANMTEFGRSPLLSHKRLSNLGYNIVLYPLTALRLALRAVEEGLTELLGAGTQEHLVEKMMTRDELYGLLRYEPNLAADNYDLATSGTTTPSSAITKTMRKR